MKKIILATTLPILAIAIIVIVINYVEFGGKKPDKSVNYFEYKSDRILLTKEDGTQCVIEGEQREKIIEDLSRYDVDDEHSVTAEDCPIRLDFDNGREAFVSAKEPKWIMVVERDSTMKILDYSCYMMDSEIHDYIVEEYYK